MQPIPRGSGDPLGGWLTIGMGFVALIYVLRMLTMPKRPRKAPADGGAPEKRG